MFCVKAQLAKMYHFSQLKFFLCIYWCWWYYSGDMIRSHERSSHLVSIIILFNMNCIKITTQIMYVNILMYKNITIFIVGLHMHAITVAVVSYKPINYFERNKLATCN